MAKIIILRGNSGSGKTTIARELLKRLGPGTMLISQDVVRREMIYVKDRPNNMAVDLLKTLVIFAREHCDVAILEGILNVEIYEKLFGAIGEMYAGNIFAYYFDLPFEETMKRHSQKSSAGEFGETEMRRWWKEKDYILNIIEKILTEDMDKNCIINLIIHDTT